MSCGALRCNPLPPSLELLGCDGRGRYHTINCDFYLFKKKGISAVIEDFVKARLCKLCAILRFLYDLMKDVYMYSLLRGTKPDSTIAIAVETQAA